VHPDLAQVTTSGYRSPSSLPGGAVLVVGASASGAQIAQELARAGRRVVLAVGGHTRMPRRYRGRDILWWLDRIGSLDRVINDLPDREHAVPSRRSTRRGLAPAVSTSALLNAKCGSPDGWSASTAPPPGSPTWPPHGYRGRAAVPDPQRIDRFADAYGSALAPRSPPAISVPAPRRYWTCGSRGDIGGLSHRFRRGTRGWSRCSVRMRIRHRRGVTDVPGLYAIRLRFQHRRSSTFIDGAAGAAYLANHIYMKPRPRGGNGR
jgi:putative flavoprotein involved in K+ transport